MAVAASEGRHSARSKNVLPGINDLPGVRDNLYTNLLLLGFNPIRSEVKHKIVFNKHMFDLPNKKAMEVIVYYLFCQLNEALCLDLYRDCWPVYDKKQEQQFRRISSEWISRISKETPNSDLPRSSAMGILMSPGGEKFYRFLRSFATHVLEDNLKKNAPDDFLVPNFSLAYETHSRLRGVHVSSMKKMIVIYSTNVMKKLQVAVECHKEWRDYVGKLAARHREVNRLDRTLKKKLNDLQALQKRTASIRLPHTNPNISTSQYDVEVMIHEELSDEKRATRMKKVKQLWRSIQDFITQNDHQKQVIDAILSGNVDQHAIKANDLCFKIPELLIKKYGELYQQGLVDNTYKEGKPNILSLLTLWNISSEELYEALKHAPIDIHKGSIELKSKELHSSQANMAKQLQKKLTTEALVEQVKNQISKLRAQLDSITTHVTSDQFTIQELPYVPVPQYTVMPLNMSLLPPTPLKQLQSFNVNSSEAITPPKIPIVSTVELSTAKRVKELNDTIQRHATTRHKWIDTSSLLTSTINRTHNILPVMAHKGGFTSVKRRIEYYSDDDDEDDSDHDDADDTTLSLNSPESQLVSPSTTPVGHGHDGINLNHSPSPNSHQDSLAEKIASYVAASSGDSSPDSKLMNYETPSTDEEVSFVSALGTTGEGPEREESQAVLSMTELQSSSSEGEMSSDKEYEWPIGVTPDDKTVKARTSQQHHQQLTEDTIQSLSDTPTLNKEVMTDKDLDWPVGVTPDIKALKARISQRRKQQLSRDTITATLPLKNKLMLGDSSWLDVGRNNRGFFPVSNTPRLNKTQEK